MSFWHEPMQVLMIIVAAVLWGTSGVCGQYLFEQYPTDASWMITVRQLAAGALFLGWLVFKKKNILAIWGVGGRDIKRGDDARGNARNRFDLLFFTYGGLLGAQYGFYYTISLANAPTATNQGSGVAGVCTNGTHQPPRKTAAATWLVRRRCLHWASV